MGAQWRHGWPPEAREFEAGHNAEAADEEAEGSDTGEEDVIAFDEAGGGVTQLEPFGQLRDVLAIAEGA